MLLSSPAFLLVEIDQFWFLLQKNLLGKVFSFMHIHSFVPGSNETLNQS